MVTELQRNLKEGVLLLNLLGNCLFHSLDGCKRLKHIILTVGKYQAAL